MVKKGRGWRPQIAYDPLRIGGWTLTKATKKHFIKTQQKRRIPMKRGQRKTKKFCGEL